MKRSEMIEIIAEALLQGLYGGDSEECEEAREESYMHRLKTAAIALKAAEGAGMLPPTQYDKLGHLCFPQSCAWTLEPDELEEEFEKIDKALEQLRDHE